MSIGINLKLALSVTKRVIQLKTCVIYVSDGSNYYISIPVWKFYGYSVNPVLKMLAVVLSKALSMVADGTLILNQL